MPSVIIKDQYGQPWKIEKGDPLYEEAKKEPADTVWPIAKLSQNRGWGWWTVFAELGEFEKEIKKMGIPSPGENKLLKIGQEYTPLELQEILQHYGSYLSTLYYLEGMQESFCHALKEGFKTGLAVAVSQTEGLKANTVAGKEAEVLAGNNTLKETRKAQITSEAKLELLKGWRQAYEQAWNTVSRIISLRSSETILQTGRHA